MARAVVTAALAIGRGILRRASVRHETVLENAIVLMWSPPTADLTYAWTGGDRYPGSDLQGVCANSLRSSLLHIRGTPQLPGKDCFDDSYTTWL